jgi:hypothetical protein
MDTWINEGLSTAAEYMYLCKHQASSADTSSRFYHFNNDPYGTIANGNNFFVWGNHTSEAGSTVLDDYASVYLFFQWLRLQNNGNSGIYKEIIKSGYYDERAITGAAATLLYNGYGLNYSNWETLLRTWLAANYIKSSTGPYGYKNDSVLNNVAVWAIAAPQNKLNLAPGEAVYSAFLTAPYTPPASGTSIRYAGLYKTGASITTNPPYSGTGNGSRLLTFNANVNKNGSPETAWLAGGEADDKPPVISVGGRQVASPQIYAVDPRDLWGRSRE